MSNLWHHWIKDWRDNHGEDTIRWKTTVGIGDSMYGLNIAYMRAFVNQKPTKFQLHFFHDKDYVHHYEDPESVASRVEYIRDRYMWKDIVDIEYVYNSTDTKLYKQFYQGITRHKNSELYRYWALDPTLSTSPRNRKIVLWRPTNNMTQQVSNDKHILLDWEWQRLIDRLEDFGYNVTEIDYRTPVREALYHIRTCECCISYEGMWHYISKNLFKPHIVIGTSSISKWHTPAAVVTSKGFYIDRDLKKLDYTIEAATERSEVYKKLFFRFVNGW
tara:strand:+ start:2496 stop:3317 length:822 start_codon:yes stop_codon:yes gene_type:complete